MLRIVLEFYDPISAIGSLHQVGLRSSAHPANVLLSVEYTIVGVCAD
jgi:hypothetical protein